MATTTTVEPGSYLSGIGDRFVRGWSDFRLGYAREPMKYTLLFAAVIILDAAPPDEVERGCDCRESESVPLADEH